MYRLAIIDDNRATADMIAQSINWAALGCQVVGVAYDGLRGKTLLLTKRPHVIIADIRMPGLDGLAMVETVKSQLPGSRVIFISAYDDFTYARKALNLRASDYLLKPFENSQLTCAVQRALGELAPPCVEAPESQASHSLQVAQMLQYIKAHTASQLTLQELSEHFGLTPSYISALIKKETGENYQDWGARARMDTAKRLLQDPGLRIEEIAGAVGYKNYISFYKAFVKYAGVSPTDYRNRRLWREPGGREGGRV